MTSAEHEISEHDVVTFRASVGTWPAGTSGTVVSDYDHGMLLVEISNSSGEMLDLIVVHADQLILQQRWPAAVPGAGQS
jgi:hypothetical protein